MVILRNDSATWRRRNSWKMVPGLERLTWRRRALGFEAPEECGARSGACPPRRVGGVGWLEQVASGSYRSSVRAVGLKVLKNKLSEYVRLAERGETVLVTDRDRVVAELVPPRPGRSELVGDARLADAVRRGWLVPAPLAGQGAPPRLPVAPTKRILAELDRDRSDR
jgi:antitoxin (DNA-binding transcriptional repressor) of toxin-antitoxin stability system